MNLSFNRHGVKLFFLTFAVEGRRKLLSTVTDETTRPTLTDLGAAVKALWRSVHKVYPWLGTSDYVIMPDHVHLLLVVDFDRYDPSAEDSREIAAGRLAILSDFTDTPAIASRDMRLSPAAAHAFRANCLAMNDLAAKLCEV